MQSTKRRRTSKYAQGRQHVNVAALKFVDYLRTGQVFVYPYQGKEFRAVLTPVAHLRAATNINDGKRARFRDTANGNLPVYDNPTNWTEDCIAQYNSDNGKTVTTRASPYNRIAVLDANGLRTPLQSLRDKYMAEYQDVVPATTPTGIRLKIGAGVGGSASASSSSASRSPGAPPPASSSSSSSSSLSSPGIVSNIPRPGEEVSVDRMREILGRSYRDVAYFFERRHTQLCKAVRSLRRMLKNDSTRATKELAILDDKDDWAVVATQSVDNTPVPPPRRGVLVAAAAKSTTGRKRSAPAAPSDPRLVDAMSGAQKRAERALDVAKQHDFFSSALFKNK